MRASRAEARESLPPNPALSIYSTFAIFSTIVYLPSSTRFFTCSRRELLPTPLLPQAVGRSRKMMSEELLHCSSLHRDSPNPSGASHCQWTISRVAGNWPRQDSTWKVDAITTPASRRPE
jgi:hypothetical protein